MSEANYAAINEALKRGLYSVEQAQAMAEIYRRKEADRQQRMSFIEPALTVASGAIAEPISGLVGLAATPYGVDAAANAINKTQQALTYQPRTDAGQQGLQTLGETLAPIGEAIQSAETYLGDTAYDLTGSPFVAAGAASLPTIGMELLGLKGARAIPGKQYEFGDIYTQAHGQKGLFAGIRAKGADLDAQKKAEQMMASGADRDAIWNETGWFKDVDDQWKFEIDDPAYESGAVNKGALVDYGGMEESSLGDLLNHPELFKAYQDAKDINVAVNPGLESKGVFSADSNTIGIEGRSTGKATGSIASELESLYQDRDVKIPAQDKAALDSGDFTPEEIAEGSAARLEFINKRIAELEAKSKSEGDLSKGQYSTAIHETQHAIQQREGFGRGGSDSQFKDKDLSASKIADAEYEQAQLMINNRDFAQAVRERNKEFINLSNKYADENGRIDWGAVPDNEADAYMKLNDKFESFDEWSKYDDLESVKYREQQSPTTQTAFEQYQRLAGEAEARNVQTRLDLTSKQRRETPPWKTLDVPESELIVRKQ